LRQSPSLGFFGNTGNDVLKVKNRTRQLGVSPHQFADEGSTGSADVHPSMSERSASAIPERLHAGHAGIGVVENAPCVVGC
jgi:hypothetical protein